MKVDNFNTGNWSCCTFVTSSPLTHPPILDSPSSSQFKDKNVKRVGRYCLENKSEKGGWFFPKEFKKSRFTFSKKVSNEKG